MRKAAVYCLSLFRVVDRAALADHIDLDLPGVTQFTLNLSTDVMSNNGETVIGDTVRFNEDPDFSAGLNRIRLIDTVEFIGDLFQSLKSVDVVFNAFVSCARSSS